MGVGKESDNGFENGGGAITKKGDPVLTRGEIGAIIRCKKILQKIGHGSDLNIKELCEDIGVSRKTAYSYDGGVKDGDKQGFPAPNSGGFLWEIELLKERLERVELENEGLRISKMIVEDLKKKGFLGMSKKR